VRSDEVGEVLSGDTSDAHRVRARADAEAADDDHVVPLAHEPAVQRVVQRVQDSRVHVCCLLQHILDMCLD